MHQTSIGSQRTLIAGHAIVPVIRTLRGLPLTLAGKGDLPSRPVIFLLGHIDRPIIPILIGEYLPGTAAKGLDDLRQVCIDRVQMDTLLFAELRRVIQRLIPPVGPEDNLGTIGLLLLEPGDGLIDGITDLGELVRGQTAVEVHRNDLRPNFLVFRSLDCFYIHLVHVFSPFQKYQDVL